MTKVLITGSRTIMDVDKVFEILDKEVKKGDIIIHGGAKGTDSIAQAWARQRKIEAWKIEPIYRSIKEYYLHRNAEMVGMCEKVIAIWDGKSRGTEFTIRYAKARKIETVVFRIE